MVQDVTIFERTVNGQIQYKTVQNRNLGSRIARKVYADAGWVKSSGNAAPVGVPKVKKAKPAKAEPDGVDTEE